jgi:hypothetical protein
VRVALQHSALVVVGLTNDFSQSIPWWVQKGRRATGLLPESVESRSQIGWISRRHFAAVFFSVNGIFSVYFFSGLLTWSPQKNKALELISHWRFISALFLLLPPLLQLHS